MHEGVALRVDDHLDRVDRALDDIAAGEVLAHRTASVGGSVEQFFGRDRRADVDVIGAFFEAGSLPQDAAVTDNAPGCSSSPGAFVARTPGVVLVGPGFEPNRATIDALAYPGISLGRSPKTPEPRRRGVLRTQ